MGNAHERAVIDKRGYRGSEKNRTLSPEEVLWAREEHYQGRITTRELATKWGMGMASVGRVIRGDTYANVGEALPRAEAVEAQLKSGPAADRLLEELTEIYGEGKTPAQAPAAPAGPSALDQFLAGKVEADPMEGEDTSGLFGKP